VKPIQQENNKVYKDSYNHPWNENIFIDEPSIIPL